MYILIYTMTTLTMNAYVFICIINQLLICMIRAIRLPLPIPILLQQQQQPICPTLKRNRG